MFECLLHARHFIGHCVCTSEQRSFHCLLSWNLWSRGEDGHSSNKHTSNVYAQIVISPLKERNNLDEGGNLGRALSGDKI